MLDVSTLDSLFRIPTPPSKATLIESAFLCAVCPQNKLASHIILCKWLFVLMVNELLELDIKDYLASRLGSNDSGYPHQLVDGLSLCFPPF